MPKDCCEFYVFKGVVLIVSPKAEFPPDEIKIEVIGAIRHISRPFHPSLIFIDSLFLGKVNHTVGNSSVIDQAAF